ncbi:MAG TPA: S8 family serine peptidase [Solirubrobacteraceae bacterium]|nr:S8 family serine peptidase [Solirubrobacteraceae bacterium]
MPACDRPVPSGLCGGIGLTRRQLALAALAGGLALLSSPASPASALSPLPRSDYSVRSVCAAPAPGHVACLALELVPRTAAARARTHPLGMRTAQAIRAGSAAQGADGLGPRQLRDAYFPGEEPQAPAAQPQTIALVDPYNDLEAEADLGVYDEEFGLPACSAADGCFEQVNQNGEKGKPPFPGSVGERHEAESLCEDANAPENESEAACEKVELADGWSLEMSLDIEMAHAICQNCHIVLVEAQSSARTSLEAAEQTAARPRSEAGVGAGEISNSWGSEEPASDSEAFNHPGIVVAAASGDHGYLGRKSIEEGGAIGVEYPASSPHVVSVGGTSLTLTGEGGRAWASESVWGGSGGGCSVNLPAPAWQREVSDWSAVGCGTGSESRRASNDVAADADPYTGVAVYDSVPYLAPGEPPRDGSPPGWAPLGGTSVASPVIASMFALAGGSHGVAYPAQTLYSHLGSGLLHDIAEGGNGQCEGFYEDGCSGSLVPLSPEDCGRGALICNASTGYDGPSGVGTPDGAAAFAPPLTRRHGAGSPEAPLSEACGEPAGATEAKACGTLDPHAAATVGYHFAYNKGSSCLGGRETALVPEAQHEHSAVFAELVGLEPDTEYAYCLIASDPSGETEGSTVTLTTGPIAPRSPLTERAAEIATETVTLEGRLTAERAPTVWYFEYAPGSSCGGAGAGRTPEAQDTRPVEPIEVRAPVSGLAPGTEYSACLIAKNPAGASAGSRISFTTKAIAPRVVSVAAHAGTSEATIEGHVLPGAQSARCALQYGRTEAYGIQVPCSEDPGGSDGTASVHLTGLEPGSEYDYRLVLENSSGPSGPGEGKGTFTTQTRPPLLSAVGASNVGSSSALLSGTVAPEGARTRYWFEYGETAALGQSTPGGEVPAGTGKVRVTPEAISGLTPGTLYHYRLRAENKWQEALGETQTFTTASAPPTVTGGSPTTTGGSPSTSPGGSQPGGSLTAPLSSPLTPTTSATMPAGPKTAKKTPKKVAKCKRGGRREHRRCLKKKHARRPVGKRSDPTSGRRRARS